MARFLIIRLSLIVVTLLAVSIAIFTLIELVPGDAAQVMLGQQATPDNLKNLRAQMGLDRPPHVRYLDWITRSRARRPRRIGEIQGFHIRHNEWTLG